MYLSSGWVDPFFNHMENTMTKPLFDLDDLLFYVNRRGVIAVQWDDQDLVLPDGRTVAYTAMWDDCDDEPELTDAQVAIINTQVAALQNLQSATANNLLRKDEEEAHARKVWAEMAEDFKLLASLR